MLTGLDTVAWSDLTHAYGAAEDVPELLRDAASADAEEAAAAVDDLNGSIFHQGTVYPATVAAVPFLARLAASAPHGRAGLLWTIGMLADARHAYGDAFAQVRDAVAAQRTVLTPLLDDPDPAVREAAAYTAARAGAADDVLGPRWAAETVPSVRASLALAVGGGFARTLAETAVREEPAVRAAAALALVRLGARVPSTDALVTAVAADATVHYCWAGSDDWLGEVVAALPDAEAVDVLGRLARSDRPETRRAALWTVTERCDASRAAPAVFTPLLLDLLETPDARGDAIRALRRVGAAAAPAADALATAAGAAPAHRMAADRVAAAAVLTLQRLGDPRWVTPFCAAIRAGHRPGFEARSYVRPTLAVREALPEFADDLAPLIASWGADAEPLVPDLIAALPHAGPPVAAALLTLGHDDVPAAVPHWRTLAAERADLAAGVAVHRLTGDPGPLRDALRARLVDRVRAPQLPVPRFDGLGDVLAPLAPQARTYLTGKAARIHPERQLQILAARVAGPDAALPAVEAVLAGGDTPARDAAELIADWAAPALRSRLEPLLRDRLGDRWNRLAAARALARFGIPTADLAGPLTSGLADYGGRFALGIIEELGAVETIPALRAALEGDERLPVAGSADDVVWADEAFRERIAQTIRTLTRAGHASR